MNKLKIKFLGSGSAFVDNDINFQSNVLMTFEDDYKLLIDAGTDIKSIFKFYNMNVTDINGVAITHAHSDHAGGLEYIAFLSKYVYKHELDLCLDTAEQVNTLWEYTLKGGLGFSNNEYSYITSYFNVKKSKYIKYLKNIHVKNKNNCMLSHSIYVPEYDVYFSGDTKEVTVEHSMYLVNSDIIFHDCEFADYPNSVHTQFKELCDLDESIKQKTWLYHYSGKAEDHKSKVLDNGFAGIVERGQEFELVRKF